MDDSTEFFNLLNKNGSSNFISLDFILWNLKSSNMGVYILTLHWTYWLQTLSILCF